MLKHLITFLLIFSCLIITSTVKSQSTFQGKQIQKGVWNGKEVEYVAGEILFKLKPGISLQNILPILNNKGIEVVEQPDVLGIAFGTCAEDIDIISLIKEINLDPAFEFIEPNFIGRAGADPNDTDFNKQWGLKNTSQIPPGGTNDADIDAPEAWDINQGSSSVIIAIMDSGIPMQNGSLSHHDLDDPNKIIIGEDKIGDGDGR